MTERERDIHSRFEWWLDEAARSERVGMTRTAEVCRVQAFAELALLDPIDDQHRRPVGRVGLVDGSHAVLLAGCEREDVPGVGVGGEVSDAEVSAAAGHDPELHTAGGYR